LKIKEESGNKKGEATTLLNIGGYYLELGNYEEAENYYNESFAISKDLSHIYGLATTWMRFGNLANLQNDHTKADTLYNKAMDLAQKIISSDLIYKLYYRKALNYIAINNNDDAYENLFKSIEIIEEIRYEIRVEEDRSSFMKNKLPIYKTMIEL